MLTFVISCVDKTLNIKILLPKLRKERRFYYKYRKHTKPITKWEGGKTSEPISKLI